ncbi:MAG TPA: class D sortase [Candidatus Angelobacter sp.]
MSRATNYRRKSRLAAVDRTLIILGILLLGFYVSARLHGFFSSRAALRAVQQQKPAETAAIADTHDPALPADSSAAALDPSSWSHERLKAYQKNTIRAGTPLAILRIPKLELEVPVLEGTDRITLNSGVGRIVGTALPGQNGNIGIAGHRDGFFRGLKDIHAGDTLELIANHRTDTYIVDRIHITEPRDVSVLRPGVQPQLTLVTCYPFYFVGPAPQRYVVRASLKQTQISSAPAP